MRNRCDLVRPLGSFLAGFEHDKDHAWNRKAIMPLNNALKSYWIKLSEFEQTAADFLQSKFSTGDPVCMYAAFRIWNDYLRIKELYRDRDRAQEVFMGTETILINNFFVDPPLEYNQETGKLITHPCHIHYYRGIRRSQAQLTLWYPARKDMTETAVTYFSFNPVIAYYSERLCDWGLCIRICKVCGKIFLAKNQRYEICSDTCRKKQSLQNKRDFDTRARENNYDLAYKNECQNWRNKINKAKKTPVFPADRLEEMQSAFTSFKTEALQRKAAVKNKTASPLEFTDWLYQQSHIIVELADIGAKQDS